MSESITSHQNARGREATKVTEIPVRGWRDILLRTYREVSGDRVMLVAAGVTFYALLALVPALTALVSVYGLFADPSTLNRHVELLQGFIPSEALGIVRDQLQRLTEQGRTKLGVTSLVSVAVALWSANAGMKAVFEAMNIAYDEEEKRGFLKLTAISLAFTLGTIVTIVMLIGLVVVLPRILQVFGFGPGARLALRIGGVVLVLALLTCGLAMLYRFGPSRQVAKWRWITPGAVLAILVTLIASALFSWYLASFGNYSATYGSLGAIFGFMTWLWITTIIVIVGAELNAESEHQTRRDTTTGAPLPMGQRGAVMADTVGASAHRSNEHTAPGGRGRAAANPRGPWLAQLALVAGAIWLRRRSSKGDAR